MADFEDAVVQWLCTDLVHLSDLCGRLKSVSKDPWNRWLPEPRFSELVLTDSGFQVANPGFCGFLVNPGSLGDYGGEGPRYSVCLFGFDMPSLIRRV